MNRWGETIPALRPDGSHVPEGAGRLAFLLLAGYMLVLPTAGTVALRNLLFFSALLLTLFAALRWKTRLQLPFALPWVLYGAVALASLTRAIDPAYSLGEIKAEIFYGIIATMLAGTWFTRTRAVESLLVALAAGSVVMGLVACWQGLRDALQGLPFDPARLGSLHTGVGDYSTYIVAVMPFLLGMLWRHRASRRASLVIGGTILLNIVGATITRNRAVFPSLVVEGLVVALLLMRADPVWMRSRKVVLWIAAFVVLALALFLVQFMLRIDANPLNGPLDRDPRWEIWGAAFDNIRSNPWWGGGFGRSVFSYLNPSIVGRESQYWHAHNLLLDKGVQMGIPGILAFACLILAAARGAWLRRGAVLSNDSAAMLSACGIALVTGVLVKNTTDDFFVRDQGWLFWLLAASIASSLTPWRRSEIAEGAAPATLTQDP